MGFCAPIGPPPRASPRPLLLAWAACSSAAVTACRGWRGVLCHCPWRSCPMAPALCAQSWGPGGGCEAGEGAGLGRARKGGRMGATVTGGKQATPCFRDRYSLFLLPGTVGYLPNLFSTSFVRYPRPRAFATAAPGPPGGGLRAGVAKGKGGAARRAAVIPNCSPVAPLCAISLPAVPMAATPAERAPGGGPRPRSLD